MEYEIYKDGELYHWGVRGMRWGVRRYQNKDGSLTDKGKKRLRAEQAKVREEEKTLKNRKAVKARLDRLEARKKAVEEGKKELDKAEGKAKADRKAERDSKKAKGKDSKKTLKDMTDEELAAAINRARMEDTYNQLRPTVEKQTFMKKMVDEAVKPALISSGRKFLEDAIGKAAEKVFKDKVDPDSLEALKKEFDTLDYKQRIDKIKNPDKYLSEEDKSKRQKREHEAEDRESQRRGYAHVQAEAAAKRKAEKDAADAKRQADEAAAKQQADEAARKANEARSMEYYNSTYNRSNGQRRQDNGNTNGSNPVKSLPYSGSNLPSTYVKSGKSNTSSALKALPSSPSEVSPKTIGTGKKRILDVLDRNGNVIYTKWSDDD